MDDAIAVEGLEKSYGSVRALCGVDFSARTGSVLGLRSLWIGTPAHTDVWMSFIWCFALIAIFAPLAVARYRQVAAR